MLKLSLVDETVELASSATKEDIKNKIMDPATTTNSGKKLSDLVFASIGTDGKLIVTGVS